MFAFGKTLEKARVAMAALPGEHGADALTDLVAKLGFCGYLIFNFDEPQGDEPINQSSQQYVRGKDPVPVFRLEGIEKRVEQTINTERSSLSLIHNDRQLRLLLLPSKDEAPQSDLEGEMSAADCHRGGCIRKSRCGNEEQRGIVY